MIVGIVQARMGASRLPGKVLLEILGRPMLALQLERLQRSRCIDKLIVATTTNPLDDEIESLCGDLEVQCTRGSENDVLDRYYQAAKQTGARLVVRLTGDDPLTDPRLIDSMIIEGRSGGWDAVTNSIEATYPEGLDATVVTFDALEKAWEEADMQSQREHVTPYILTDTKLFSVCHFKDAQDNSDLRWTVDYEEDYLFVKTIYETLYPANKCFTTQDIYQILAQDKSLQTMNSHFQRNAGLLKSLREDKKVC